MLCFMCSAGNASYWTTTQQISGCSGDVAQGTQVGGIWLGERMSNGPKQWELRGKFTTLVAVSLSPGVLTLVSRPVHT